MAEMTLHDFVEATAQATTTEELWLTTLRHMNGLGFHRVSYHHYRSDWSSDPEKAIFDLHADGFPQDWVDYYLGENLRLIDPVIELAARKATPFFWMDTAKLMRLTDRQSDYLDTLIASGVGDGLAVQVFGPGGRDGYFGLGFATLSRPDISGKLIREVQTAAQIAHLSYCALAETESDKTVELSPREREMMGWVARGKSNSIIAEIMGVSRHTVDTMLRRVYEKLDVADRTSAAIAVVGAGLIQPA